MNSMWAPRTVIRDQDENYSSITSSQTSCSLPVAAPTRSCPPSHPFQMIDFITMMVEIIDRLMEMIGRKAWGGAGRYGLLPTLTVKHKG